MLHSRGINFVDNPEFLISLAHSIRSSEEVDETALSYITSFSLLLDGLDHIKSVYKTDLKILCDSFRYIPTVNLWKDAFLLMPSMGYNPDKNSNMYVHLIQAGKHTLKLAQAWNGLFLARVSNIELFKLMIARVEHLEYVDKVLTLLIEHHMSYAEHPEYYTKEMLFTNAVLVIHTFSKLKQAGYTADQHGYVYSFFVEQLHQWPVDYITLIITLKRLCDGSNPLLKQGLDQQNEAIATILSADNNPRKDLTYGPLNRSSQTAAIISVCERIVEAGLDNVEIYYKEGSYFFHDIPANITVNLSLMIKHANLSQLCLDEQLMDAMMLLKPLCPYWIEGSEEVIEVLNECHVAEITALNIYTDHGFLNINRLFRGVELVEEGDLSPNIIVVHDKYMPKHATVLFMLGCLVHNLINRVIHLQEVPEGQDVGLLHQVLDRQEDITQEDIALRTANPVKLPAITSYSHLPNGTAAINITKQKVHTKLDNAGAYPCIHADEGEMLLAQGKHPRQNASARMKNQILMHMPGWVKFQCAREVSIDFLFGRRAQLLVLVLFRGDSHNNQTDSKQDEKSAYNPS